MKKEKNLKGKNILFSDINKSESTELLSSKSDLRKQYFFNQRFEQIDLLKQYLQGQINSYALQFDFFDLYRNHNKIFNFIIENSNQSTISFSPDATREKEEFTLLVKQISSYCEFLDDNYNNSIDFVEVYQENEVLVSVMLFFTLVSSIAYCFLKRELVDFLFTTFN